MSPDDYETLASLLVKWEADKSGPALTAAEVLVIGDLLRSIAEWLNSD